MDQTRAENNVEPILKDDHDNGRPRSDPGASTSAADIGGRMKSHILEPQIEQKRWMRICDPPAGTPSPNSLAWGVPTIPYDTTGSKSIFLSFLSDDERQPLTYIEYDRTTESNRLFGYRPKDSS
jgi:hypothetical protein